jgi:hypothetical protein
MRMALVSGWRNICVINGQTTMVSCSGTKAAFLEDAEVDDSLILPFGIHV